MKPSRLLRQTFLTLCTVAIVVASFNLQAAETKYFRLKYQAPCEHADFGPFDTRQQAVGEYKMQYRNFSRLDKYKDVKGLVGSCAEFGHSPAKTGYYVSFLLVPKIHLGNSYPLTHEGLARYRARKAHLNGMQYKVGHTEPR